MLTLEQDNDNHQEYLACLRTHTMHGICSIADCTMGSSNHHYLEFTHMTYYDPYLLFILGWCVVFLGCFFLLYTKEDK